MARYPVELPSASIANVLLARFSAYSLEERRGLAETRKSSPGYA